MILGHSSNVKIGFWTSKYDILPHFDCQNRIWMSKCDIRPQFECQNRIKIIKIPCSASFECKNWTLMSKYVILLLFVIRYYLFWMSKIGFWMSKYDILLRVKIGLSMSKFVIQPRSECQTKLLNIKIRYSAWVRLSKYDCECQNTIFGIIWILKSDI